jgi:precorrin-3B C17-methyltransferase
MSLRAHHVLQSVEVVAGYTAYIQLIAPLIEGKQVISTAMTKEVDRVQAAIEKALAGHPTAIVSSGDPGIYAMAGLALDICQQRAIPVIPAGQPNVQADGEAALKLEVVPGIPALCSGASLLGAPLTHDFAVISLSTLLTPWEVIERRLEAAAQADFVIVLYNPKSKKRMWQLTQAQQIVMRHRAPQTPVGIVTQAMRSEQQVDIVDLEKLHLAPVGMQTTVFIGSSASSRYRSFLFTPRGYKEKYQLI